MLQGVREHDEFPPCPFCRQPTGSLHSRKGDHAIDRHGLQRRAAQGDPVAQYNLSGQYDNPDCGLPRDYQASAAWAALAAMGGHVRGYNNLAYAILTGEGVPADARRAHPWFRRPWPARLRRELRPQRLRLRKRRPMWPRPEE